MLSVRSNVWKKYGNKEAVKGLNLALKANECFGLLGSNGAGKTTTFKMLTGDIKNTAGDIYVCGVNVNNNREKVNARGVGVLFTYTSWYFRLNGRRNKKRAMQKPFLENREGRDKVHATRIDHSFLPIEKEFCVLNTIYKKKTSTTVSSCVISDRLKFGLRGSWKRASWIRRKREWGGRAKALTNQRCRAPETSTRFRVCAREL